MWLEDVDGIFSRNNLFHTSFIVASRARSLIVGAKISLVKRGADSREWCASENNEHRTWITGGVSDVKFKYAYYRRLRSQCTQWIRWHVVNTERCASRRLLENARPLINCSSRCARSNVRRVIDLNSGLPPLSFPPPSPPSPPHSRSFTNPPLFHDKNAVFCSRLTDNASHIA